MDWPVPKNQKDLRKWLGLANYMHKYSANYVRQFWLFLTLIGLSVLSVTHLTLPSAVLCYKQMPKGVISSAESC